MRSYYSLVFPLTGDKVTSMSGKTKMGVESLAGLLGTPGPSSAEKGETN